MSNNEIEQKKEKSKTHKTFSSLKKKIKTLSTGKSHKSKSSSAENASENATLSLEPSKLSPRDSIKRSPHENEASVQKTSNVATNEIQTSASIETPSNSESIC
jgi:regulator of replication initiation timing